MTVTLYVAVFSPTLAVIVTSPTFNAVIVPFSIFVMELSLDDHIIVLSSDVFYSDNKEANSLWKKMNVTCVEMEAAALYMNAARLGKKALAILTISDHVFTGEALTAEERQNTFNEMMEIALEIA